MWASGMAIHLYLIVAIGAYLEYQICGTKFYCRTCYPCHELPLRLIAAECEYPFLYFSLTSVHRSVIYYLLSSISVSFCNVRHKCVFGC